MVQFYSAQCVDVQRALSQVRPALVRRETHGWLNPPAAVVIEDRRRRDFKSICEWQKMRDNLLSRSEWIRWRRGQESPKVSSTREVLKVTVRLLCPTTRPLSPSPPPLCPGRSTGPPSGEKIGARDEWAVLSVWPRTPLPVQDRPAPRGNSHPCPPSPGWRMTRPQSSDPAFQLQRFRRPQHRACEAAQLRARPRQRLTAATRTSPLHGFLNQSQGGMCICRVLGIGAGVSRECFGP